MVTQRVVYSLSIIGLSVASFKAQADTVRPLPNKVVMPAIAANRSIFLNGIDVSSARDQDLRNVHVRISDNGDIFITAPQYQVTEEETFTPLSSYVPGGHTPEHRPPVEMGEAIKGDTEALRRTAASEKTPEKPTESKSSLPEKPASAPAK